MVKRLFALSLLFLTVLGITSKINSYYLQFPSEVGGLRTLERSTTIETIPNPESPYVFSALPDFDQQIKTSVKTADAREEIIRQYLLRHNSPLEPHAGLIVSLSDQYRFDYRWLVAIAQQESNLCKRIPENSYNCWGWGIYPEPSNPEILKVTRFASYEDALRRIAPQFTKIFLKGSHYKEPLEVMKTYTPPSDGSWANGVSQFFDHLE